MGKLSPKDKGMKTSKHKRRQRASNKYLKPGALAQIRNSKAAASKSCTDLGKKRVDLVEIQKIDCDVEVRTEDVLQSPSVLTPQKFGLTFSPAVESLDQIKQSNLLRTPKTPRYEDCVSASRLESLPMDVLVNVLCHLHHDQLRPVFHVSRRVRKAVLLARQFHHNYTTPDRSRQEMLRTMTPLPTEHWPFVSKCNNGKGIWIRSPHTPKAPRHGPRPPSRIKFTEMRQIAAVLFQESSAFPPTTRCMVPSALSKPLCKSLASNRVLFYEDELCQAVAQNKLR